jgi:uncharacterized protein YdgA (DUF945 family)
MDLEDLGKAPVTLAVVLALGSVISAAGWFFISRIEDSLEKMREAQVSIDKALTSQGKDLNSLVEQFAKLSAPPPPVAQPAAKAP